jgi:hypothetical protein
VFAQVEWKMIAGSLSGMFRSWAPDCASLSPFLGVRKTQKIGVGKLDLSVGAGFDGLPLGGCGESQVPRCGAEIKEEEL